MPKAQVWSLDILIATVIFVVVLAAAIVVSQQAEDETRRLTMSSQLIANRLTAVDDPLGIVDPVTNEVNDTKLNELLARDYDGLKEELGLQDDFCMVIVDQEGRLVLVGNASLGERLGVGNEQLKFNISGAAYNCSGVYP